MTHRRIALGSVLRVLNLFATAAASLLIMPYVVHSLGDRMYGLWSLVGTFIGYYGLLDMGLSSAVNRHMSRALAIADESEANHVFGTVLRLYSGIGAVVVALTVAVVFAAPLVIHDPSDLSIFSKVVVVLGLNLAIGFPVRVLVGTLNAHLKFEVTALIELLTLVLRTGLTVLVLMLGYKIVALAWAVLLASSPAWVLYVHFTRKYLPFLRFFSVEFSRATAKMLFSYSSYSFIIQIADILRFRMDGMVLAAYVNLAVVTHFSIAGSLVQYFIDLMVTWTSVLATMFSRQEGTQDIDAMHRTFFFASKLSVMTSSFIAFGLVAWGRAFIERWMGTPYLDAYPILIILTIGSTTAMWQIPSVPLLFGTSRHNFFAWVTIIEGLANLGLSILLVQRYGAIGVALGTCIPLALIKLVIQPVYVCRVSKIAYWRYMGRMGRTIAATGLALLIPAWISLRYARPDYKALVAVGAVSAVLYLVPLWLLEVTPEESRIIRNLLRPKRALETSPAKVS